MNDEQIRKDFEEWMGDGGLSPRAIARNSKGDYILMQTAHAWEVWKAAHTHYAKSAAPVALPEPVAAQVRFKPENDTTWSRWKVCAVEDAREIEAYTLVNGWDYEVRYLHAEQQVRSLLATGGQSAETTEGATNEVTVLPDGSAFAVYSYPLPKDHWLYAPREYEHGAEEPKELAAPILTHAAREQVISAIRYAVRGATDCGKETDFDPDALVQNAVYALCGPFNKNQPQPQSAMEEAFKKVRAELCALPRYSYRTDAKGELRRFQIHKGDWIGFDAAYALLDLVGIDAIAAAKENK